MDLRGSYFRNGPAKFRVGSDQIMHPFDGDGMVVALTFDGQGSAHFRSKEIVKTYCTCIQLIDDVYIQLYIHLIYLLYRRTI